MLGLSFDHLLKLSPKTRWGLIAAGFIVIGVMDFITPPEYVWAYLYTIPILLSVSFLRQKISQILLIVAVCATLLNLIFPVVVVHMPSVLLNRSLAALAIFISAFFMLRYIQYQRRLQEQDQLLETERQLAVLRENLTATLTHDLKTPLLGAEKALQYFSDGTFGPITPEQHEVLQALVRSNHRQVELVDNLLSVYRYDNLGVELCLNQVNLDTLIADILTEIQYVANERSISIQYSCLRTPPNVWGDAFQLKRVFANLIHNALNYSPAQSKLIIQLTEHPQALLTEIIDAGPGLPEGDLENVFHRFYRAENNRHLVGTGLGLYLSRQIITAHRGKLWAENVAPRGCKFSFMLPIS